jgi:hypothetical protein
MARPAARGTPGRPVGGPAGLRVARTTRRAGSQPCGRLTRRSGTRAGSEPILAPWTNLNRSQSSARSADGWLTSGPRFAEHWTYWSDGTGDLGPYCPECATMVELVAEAVSKDRVVDAIAASFYLRDWVMLEGRLPVVPFVSARCEVTRTAQLLGTEALGHPTLHLRDVTKLRSFDEDAFDASRLEPRGHFRTSRRVQRWSCHTVGYRPRIRSSREAWQVVGGTPESFIVCRPGGATSSAEWVRSSTQSGSGSGDRSLRRCAIV